MSDAAQQANIQPLPSTTTDPAVIPTPPATGWARIKRTFSLLEHAGEVGIERIAPFADMLGNLVGAFLPGGGFGLMVANVIKTAAKVEADAVAAGNSTGTGAQKLAAVIAATSADVSVALQHKGIDSSPATVAGVVKQIVDTVNVKAIQQ